MHMWIITVLFWGALVHILEICLLFLVFSLTGMVSSSSTDSLVCEALGTEGVQRLRQRWRGMAW